MELLAAHLAALLFFAAAPPQTEALRISAKAFHDVETTTTSRKDPASPELLNSALAFERALRDWAMVNFPRQNPAALQRAGLLRADETVDVTRIREFPNALLVQVNIRIHSGTDSAAWLYELRAHKWIRTVSFERLDRKSPSRLFSIAASPADKSGTHLIAAVRGPSGTDGCWHAVRLEVYRAGTPTAAPLLLDELHPANLCGKPPEAHAEVRGFRFTLEDRDLEPGKTRAHLLTYQLFAERPQRIQPVAAAPREFVHEWLESVWKDAANWTNPPARTTTQKTHQELGGSGTPVSGEYQGADKCPDGHWEIAILLPRVGVRYFGVKDLKNNEFQLLSVSAVAASGCSAR